MRRTLGAFLTSKRIHPFAADDVQAALRVLGAEPVDAIVLDVRLPDATGRHGSGLNLLKFLRATDEHARVPVILLTAAPLSSAEQQIARSNEAHVFDQSQPHALLLGCLTTLMGTPDLDDRP